MPGYHGLHIHEYPKKTAGCGEIGPHFNPTYAPHGSMKTRNRHCGDLGNIYAGPDGVAEISTFSGQISLFAGYSNIIGRSIGVIFFISKHVFDFLLTNIIFLGYGHGR
jgi:copper/zinc superoxide dismutase (SODC)